MSQIKVKYMHLDGDVSTAYVDSETYLGKDKWTEEPLQLKWDGKFWVMLGSEQMPVEGEN